MKDQLATIILNNAKRTVIVILCSICSYPPHPIRLCIISVGSSRVALACWLISIVQ